MTCFRVLYVQDVNIICDSGPLPLTSYPAASPERSRLQSPRPSGLGVGQAGFLPLTPTQRASVRLKLPGTTTGYNYKTTDHVYCTLYFSMIILFVQVSRDRFSLVYFMSEQVDKFNVPDALAVYKCC
jgi:hypothetical protein